MKTASTPAEIATLVASLKPHEYLSWYCSARRELFVARAGLECGYEVPAWCRTEEELERCRPEITGERFLALQRSDYEEAVWDQLEVVHARDQQGRRKQLEAA
ncbi:hypothetical protein DB347_17705 [Opitutaceae bacterium EW11]|nr:hypothetical protein DB347_17705 [Opitutaceae bacterium EW11]